MYSEQLEMCKGLFKLKGGDVEQDLITNVGQMKLHNVSVEGYIIDPDTHRLLDGPFDIV